MGNPYQGDVTLCVDGQELPMRLTLGALAELEEALGDDNLMALIERFEGGAFKARDIVALLAAGLRGSGWSGDAGDLLSAQIEGGPLGAARVAGQLLSRAFAIAQ